MSCDCYMAGFRFEEKSGYELNPGDDNYEPQEWDANWYEIWAPNFGSITYDGNTYTGAGASAVVHLLPQDSSFTASQHTTLNRIRFKVRFTLTRSLLPVKLTWDIVDEDETVISSDEVTLTSGSPTHEFQVDPPSTDGERKLVNLQAYPCPFHL